jgi:SAM-dependent methyltransferase
MPATSPLACHRCGLARCWVVTEALAQALPGVTIVATDLNQPMLDHAATKPGLSRVQFRQADAAKLPFDNEAFDAVVCQFGAMFFPDRPAAFREVYRVLKPGGRFLFNVWERVADNPIVVAALGGWRVAIPTMAPGSSSGLPTVIATRRSSGPTWPREASPTAG